jgi:hypothetical protein
MPNAPAIGLITMRTPAITESAPAAMRKASPRICLRSRIAAAISATPVTIAHRPTSRARSRTVIPGLTRTRIPAMMPSAPRIP